MIKDAEYLRRFEDDFNSKQKLTYEEALRILESMWHEALSVGVLSRKDPLEGIDVSLRIAKVLNSCSED
ncbi:MAG: hypothetical protein ABIK53_07655 [bacterium]